MENEIMELENMNGMNELVVVDEAVKRSGSKRSWAIVAGVAALAAGAAIMLVRKNRDKIEERKAEKLRQKGYVVYKPEASDMELAKDEHVFEVEED